MGAYSGEEEDHDDEQNSLSYPHISMMLGTMTMPIYYTKT